MTMAGHMTRLADVPQQDPGAIDHYHRPMTAVDIRANVQLIQEVMHSVMKVDVHYGTIPGTNKPTLYKAGSEKILSTFRIAAEPVVTDLSTHDEARFRVEVRASAQGSGLYLGSGVGEASSMEEKYKWRAAVCQEEFDETTEDRRRSVWKKSQNGPYQVHQVRTNHADVANTILKMAKKRGQIDMTLTVTAASDVFAQDLEDLPEGVRDAAQDEGAAATTKTESKPPQRKSGTAAPSGNLGAIVVPVAGLGFKDGGGENGKKKWRKWSFNHDGQWYQAFDDSPHAPILQEAAKLGAKVEVTFVQTQYGRDIKTCVLVADREPGGEG